MSALAKLRFAVPFGLFAILLGLLGYRLFLAREGFTPDLIPSALIDKPAPQFDLPPLFPNHQRFGTADLKGKVTLVNFFASWCVPCREEHAAIAQIPKSAGIELVGIDYKDPPADASLWLEELGNPYSAVAVDAEGKAGIDFGVYGVPETYLIDGRGIIRFKQTGPLTPKVIQSRLIPLAKSLDE
jgi:DsbE subfamily thiol:disulfide oxidoreductase